MTKGGAAFWNATDAGFDFFNTGIDDAGYLRGLVELWKIVGGDHNIAPSPAFSAQVIDWLLAHPKP